MIIAASVSWGGVILQERRTLATVWARPLGIGESQLRSWKQALAKESQEKGGPHWTLILELQAEAEPLNQQVGAAERRGRGRAPPSRGARAGVGGDHPRRVGAGT